MFWSHFLLNETTHFGQTPQFQALFTEIKKRQQTVPF
jgi:hypothetical protein